MPAPASSVWRFSTIAREGQPGGDTWGQLPDLLRAGGDTWIAGSYDPGLNLTYWGVAQPKPWLRVSRGAKPGDKGAVTRVPRSRSIPTPAGSKWYFQHAPGESLRHGRGVRARPGRSRRKKAAVHHRQARNLVEDRSRDRPVSRLTRKPSTRTSSARIDPKTGEPTYRSDILEQQIGQWFQICPSTEGGHNWQAMSYHPANGAADHPAEPELHDHVRPQSGIQGEFGRRSGRPPLSRDAEHATATSASWRPTTCAP